MTNLRFKEYTFRHNPRTLMVRSRRLTAQVSCFGLGQALQELGPGLTEVEGEGELFGTDAMEQFLALRQLQEQGGSGMGLALCARIAALHGTTLQFASVPSQGTTVSFCLQKAGSQPEVEP